LPALIGRLDQVKPLWYTNSHTGCPAHLVVLASDGCHHLGPFAFRLLAGTSLPGLMIDDSGT